MVEVEGSPLASPWREERQNLAGVSEKHRDMYHATTSKVLSRKEGNIPVPADCERAEISHRPWWRLYTPLPTWEQ